MAGGFEKPQRRQRPADGAEGVHQPFEAEGAAVCVWRSVRGEKRFFRGGADTAAKPRGGTGEKHMVSVRRKRERRCRKSSESVAKDGKRLAALQAIGEVARGKFRKAG